MGTFLAKTPNDPADRNEQRCGGDRRALTVLFEQHRERFRRLVDQRLDARSRARLDGSEFVRHTFLDVAKEHDERPRVIGAFFAFARHGRGKPPGTGGVGITG
jgi:DNA-directed RNA polymerase specialized sigma24 family protein